MIQAGNRPAFCTNLQVGNNPGMTHRKTHILEGKSFRHEFAAAQHWVAVFLCYAPISSPQATACIQQAASLPPNGGIWRDYDPEGELDTPSSLPAAIQQAPIAQ